MLPENRQKKQSTIHIFLWRAILLQLFRGTIPLFSFPLLSPAPGYAGTIFYVTFCSDNGMSPNAAENAGAPLQGIDSGSPVTKGAARSPDCGGTFSMTPA